MVRRDSSLRQFSNSCFTSDCIFGDNKGNIGGSSFVNACAMSTWPQQQLTGCISCSSPFPKNVPFSRQGVQRAWKIDRKIKSKNYSFKNLLNIISAGSRALGAPMESCLRSKPFSKERHTKPWHRSLARFSKPLSDQRCTYRDASCSH